MANPIGKTLHSDLHLLNSDRNGRSALSAGRVRRRFSEAAVSPARAADRPPQPRPHLHERAANLRAAQAIDVEVEREVEQLQVVGDGAKDLEAEVAVELRRVEDGEHGGGVVQHTKSTTMEMSTTTNMRSSGLCRERFLWRRCRRRRIFVAGLLCGS